MRLLVISMLAAGCASTTAAGTHSTFPANWRIVDLTHVLAPEVPTYVGAPRMASKNLATVARDGLYVNEVTLLEHVGTHVDAPAHFVGDGTPIDRVPIERLVLEAAVIDVTAAVANDPDYAVTVDDLRLWEERYEPLSAKHIVVVRTGWGTRWPDSARYRNPDGQGVMHFPGVSLEASRMLRTRGVPAIGIDTLSTDPGSVTSFDAHKDFHAGGGYHVENLANLDKLPRSRCRDRSGTLALARWKWVAGTSHRVHTDPMIVAACPRRRSVSRHRDRGACCDSDRAARSVRRARTPSDGRRRATDLGSRSDHFDLGVAL